MQREKPIWPASRTRSDGLAGGAHLAGQADLAEDCRRRPDRPVPDARGHRGDDREVRRRLVDGHAASDVHEDVLGDEVEAGTLLEHGQEQRQAIAIEAARHPPRVAVRAGADERLHLDEQRREPSTQHSTADPGALAARSARKSCRRVRHGLAGRCRSFRRRRAR